MEGSGSPSGQYVQRTPDEEGTTTETISLWALEAMRANQESAGAGGEASLSQQFFSAMPDATPEELAHQREAIFGASDASSVAGSAAASASRGLAGGPIAEEDEDEEDLSDRGGNPGTGVVVQTDRTLLPPSASASAAGGSPAGRSSMNAGEGVRSTATFSGALASGVPVGTNFSIGGGHFSQAGVSSSTAAAAIHDDLSETLSQVLGPAAYDNEVTRTAAVLRGMPAPGTVDPFGSDASAICHGGAFLEEINIGTLWRKSDAGPPELSLFGNTMAIKDTVSGLSEAADAECWRRLHEQLDSLQANVKDFVNRRSNAPTISELLANGAPIPQENQPAAQVGTAPGVRSVFAPATVAPTRCMVAPSNPYVTSSPERGYPQPMSTAGSSISATPVILSPGTRPIRSISAGHQRPRSVTLVSTGAPMHRYMQNSQATFYSGQSIAGTGPEGSSQLTQAARADAPASVGMRSGGNMSAPGMGAPIPTVAVSAYAPCGSISSANGYRPQATPTPNRAPSVAGSTTSQQPQAQPIPVRYSSVASGSASDMAPSGSGALPAPNVGQRFVPVNSTPAGATGFRPLTSEPMTRGAYAMAAAAQAAGSGQMASASVNGVVRQSSAAAGSSFAGRGPIVVSSGSASPGVPGQVIVRSGQVPHIRQGAQTPTPGATWRPAQGMTSTSTGPARFSSPPTWAGSRVGATAPGTVQQPFYGGRPPSGGHMMLSPRPST
mmetsp:Transcript_53664/g.114563  ORF Transcript_53664/g.114563 Transcript_53664/m.114563 type:complete len:723 (-) Transcript_53664:152-2320(-)